MFLVFSVPFKTFTCFQLFEHLNFYLETMSVAQKYAFLLPTASFDSCLQNTRSFGSLDSFCCAKPTYRNDTSLWYLTKDFELLHISVTMNKIKQRSWLLSTRLRLKLCWTFYYLSFSYLQSWPDTINTNILDS